MKPEEALEKLKKIAKKTRIKDYVDLEKSHVQADKILTDLIEELLKKRGQKDLGEKITKAFNEIRKWYA